MDIKETFAELKNIIDEFKKANDKALEQKAGKGYVDSLLKEKVEKLNDAISAKQDEWQKQIDDVDARMNRLDAIENNLDDGKQLMADISSFSILTKREVSVEQYLAYKPALISYLRVGEAVTSDVKAALHVGSDPKGGYYVTPDTSGKIVKLIYESSPIRQIADVVTIGTDALEGLRDLDEAASGGWVGERQSRSETDTPDTGKWRIPAHEQFAQPKATQKMLDDSGIDIEAWLEGKVSDKLIRTENAAFVTGTGSLKPRGFLTYDEGTPSASDYEKIKQLPSGASGAFASSKPGDKLLDMVFEIKAAYRANARWAMARNTLNKARQLKDGNGNYLWLPGTFAEQVVSGSLLGYPITEAEDMPALSSNSLSIAFGDFRKGYLIVDRMGIRVLRDPYTDKPNILFYTTKRVGGDVSDFDAIKIMKFATSV